MLPSTILTGRDWTTNREPDRSMAHSTSCGAPKHASRAQEVWATRRAVASSMVGASSARPAGVSARPPTGWQRVEPFRSPRDDRDHFPRVLSGGQIAIGGDASLDDGLGQTANRRDQGAARAFRPLGVGHAAGNRLDHLHHQHRHCHVFVEEAAGQGVLHRLLAGLAGDDLLVGLQQAVLPHVEHRFELSGEGCQVSSTTALERTATAYGEGWPRRRR